MRPALVSIHDVMPETLSDVEELLRRCRHASLCPVTLLVVPGRDWRPAELDQLRGWVADGHELAGHGWHHRCRSIRGLRHRLHSWLLSRNVAEHLSLGGDEIAQLMKECRAWFREHGFDPPSLYVPPAWALGEVSAAQREAMGFEMVETLSGVLFLRSGLRRRLPLVGFEADRQFRCWPLGGWNALSRAFARRWTRPLRIAIHPHDQRLLLRQDLERTLCLPWKAVSYRTLAADGEASAGDADAELPVRAG